MRSDDDAPAPRTPLEHLQRLLDVLAREGWTSVALEAGSGRPSLTVTNPYVPGLSGVVVCDGERFAWHDGVPLAPVTDLAGVATRIVFVLGSPAGVVDGGAP